MPTVAVLSEAPGVTEPGHRSEPESAGRAVARDWSARVGVALLTMSLVLWLPLPVLPFLSWETATKAAVGGGLVVSAEVAFWLGAALAGPEAARRTRGWVRRVFGQRKSESE